MEQLCRASGPRTHVSYSPAAPKSPPERIFRYATVDCLLSTRPPILYISDVVVDTNEVLVAVGIRLPRSCFFWAYWTFFPAR